MHFPAESLNKSMPVPERGRGSGLLSAAPVQTVQPPSGRTITAPLRLCPRLLSMTCHTL